MNAPSKKLIHSIAPALVLLPLIATAGDGATPLIDQVRSATEQYLDINTAMHQGFVQGTPCVSGQDAGAMGVHFVLPARITTLVLDVTQPQALIYEPAADGAMRLVGVEYIVLDQNWSAVNPPGSTPSLQGNLLNYIASPNRYGLPAFWEIHVWAWQDNPKGSYADWNTRVTCANQPLPRS
jgi:hypothetical protein